MGLFNKKNDIETRDSGLVKDSEFLSQIVPRKGYEFHSDYFIMDGKWYCTYLTVLSKQGANRRLFPMWGIQLLPTNLGTHTTARLMMSVKAETSKWVEKYQQQADALAANQHNAAKNSNKSKSQTMSAMRIEDVQQISSDLTQENDSYLGASFKILVKTDSLSNLDAAINKINRAYNTQPNFGGMRVEPYDGEQDTEVKHVFDNPTTHVGGVYHFTASELAGEYNILTQGINDDTGEYVGDLRGETNHNAIIWDTNLFRDHVVVGSKFSASTIGGPVNFNKPRFKDAQMVKSKNQEYQAQGTTMWGVKIAQAALADNHKVVHLVLNGERVQDLGVDLTQSTSYVPMQNGSINPFEIFGDRERPLPAYAAHKSKLRLLVEQFNPELTPTDLRKYFSKLVDDFYIDNKMYRKDGEQHPEKLRLIINHDQYPTLNKFMVYLANAEKTNFRQEAEAIQRIETAFAAMEENADIFETQTTNVIDEADVAPQIIYDFSSLAERDAGKNSVMMAQFVNALSYALHGLVEGDLVIIHGVDELSKSIKGYVHDVLAGLSKHHVRTAYLYNDIDVMLEDAKFNHIADADYTLTSGMSAPQVSKYEEILGQSLPDNLKAQMANNVEFRYYLKRSSKNILFDADLLLDIPDRYKEEMAQILGGDEGNVK